MTYSSLDFIPLTKPFIGGNEIDFIASAITNNELVGDGPNTRKLEAHLAKICQVNEALFTPSCTDALDMCSMLLEIQPGDEIIVPAFTFTSTATAFAHQKATLVFADIEANTLNINPTHAETLITKLTRAIVVVHYAGIACEMDAFTALADKHNLVLIEDNAHGFGGKYKEQVLGSIGDMSTLSFHVTKNLQCGEGGAFLTNNKDYAARAHVLREKGTNRRAFLEGSIDKYTWVDHGSSYLAPDYSAAFLLAQLQHFEYIQSKREHAWNRYHLELNDWATQINVTLPTVPTFATHPSHLFWLKLPDKSDRPSFLNYLKNKGIGAAFHYQSLATSPAGMGFGRTDATPISNDTAETLVRLPLFASITDAEIDRVISAVKGWRR